MYHLTLCYIESKNVAYVSLRTGGNGHSRSIANNTATSITAATITTEIEKYSERNKEEIKLNEVVYKHSLTLNGKRKHTKMNRPNHIME